MQQDLVEALGGNVMYVTTFPCHNCAKHIVAAGLQRVVFIEPYAKSRAEHSHEDSISIGVPRAGKVQFQHFEGISPRRYRDIFQKQKRRNDDGSIRVWYEDFPRPRIDDADPATHLLREPHAIAETLGSEPPPGRTDAADAD
jgi:hypothetical protein